MSLIFADKMISLFYQAQRNALFFNLKYESFHQNALQTILWVKLLI